MEDQTEEDKYQLLQSELIEVFKWTLGSYTYQLKYVLNFIYCTIYHIIKHKLRRYDLLRYIPPFYTANAYIYVRMLVYKKAFLIYNPY